MNEFDYRDNELFAEDMPVAALAARFGTPLFVYSRRHLQEQYRLLRDTMADVDPLICFAVKSNTSAAVMDVLAREGAGADVVSSGELYRTRQVGLDPSKTVFAGVGKTVSEIEYALRTNILCFTVESEGELERISECAQRLNTTARVDIRVNPDVDPMTHKYTSTGKKETKFGVDLDRALRAYAIAVRLPRIEITGIHMHLGSPIMSITPYLEALEKIAPLCRELKAMHANFQHIDIGGGFGIPYRPTEEPFDLDVFASAVIPRLQELGLKVIMEPGRFLTGNAGILVTKVQYIKENPLKSFVIVDAAMNDLLRPALYEAYHHILPVNRTSERVFGDVVGPVCESADFLAADRDLPAVAQDDLLAVMGAGAYGYVMASTYNSRGRAAEVMVSGGRAELVRERETWVDLIKGERVPEWT